jgi:peptide/nickel transport system substrate-binding protein
VGTEDVSELDPFRPPGDTARAVDGTLYSTLLRVDPADGHLIPGVASTWEVADDVRTVTFTLPSDLRWSDGRRITAKDVVFSFRQALNADKGREIGSYLHLASETTAVDAQEVRVHLSRGLCAALYDLGAVPVVPARVWASRTDPGRLMISGGAYAVAVPGQAQFTRNPNYQPAPAHFVSWAYRRVDETAQAVDALASGLAQVAILPRVVHPPAGTRLLTAPSRRVASLAYRLDHPVLRDRTVRLAIAHAVDREALVQRLYGREAPTLRTHLPPGHWAAAAAPDPPAFNPDKAARLLTQAGWVDRDGDGIRDRDGQPLRLNLLAPLGSQAAEDIPLLLRRQLLPLGIDLRPQFAEPLTFEDNLYHGQFEIALVTWEVGLDPDQYDIWHSLGEGDEPAYNWGGYANPVVDRWLEEARVLPGCDERGRAALYGKVWTALRRDQPYTFLFAWPQAVLVRRGLEGPAPGPFVHPLWNLALWRWGKG